MKHTKRFLCLLCTAAVLICVLTVPAAAETSASSVTSDTENVYVTSPPETAPTQGEPDGGNGIGAAILSTAIPSLLFLGAVTFGYMMGKRSKRK